MPKTALPIKGLVNQQKAYETALRKAVLDPFLDSAKRATRGAHKDYLAIRGILRALPFDPALDTKTRAAAKFHINKWQSYHKAQWRKKMRRYLGVRVDYIRDADLAKQIERGIGYNFSLARTIPKRIRNEIDDDLLRLAAEAPFDEHKLTELFARKTKKAGYDLRRLARDQNSKMMGQFNEYRQVQAGIHSYVWQTSEDERVRTSHALHNQKVIRWDQRPPDTGHPGEDILCFPGSVRISPAGLKASVAYRYVGQLIEITFAEGVDITTTPNHPILTQNGWTRADCIEIGDQVFQHESRRGLAEGFLNPEFGNIDPSAKQLHILAGGTIIGDGAIGRSVDLHGHPASRDENIEVVILPSILRNYCKTLGFQMFGNRIFEKPSMAILDFPPLGAPRLRLLAETSDPDFVMRGLGQLFSFSARQMVHTDLLSFGSIANKQLHIVETMNHNMTTNAQSFRHGFDRSLSQPQFFDANMISLSPFPTTEHGMAGFEILVPHAGPSHFDANTDSLSDCGNSFAHFPLFLDSGVEMDASFVPTSVTGRRTLDHDDLVYSFETDTGILIANGIITHNCRCEALPVLEGYMTARPDKRNAAVLARKDLEERIKAAELARLSRLGARQSSTTPIDQLLPAFETKKKWADFDEVRLMQKTWQNPSLAPPDFVDVGDLNLGSEMYIRSGYRILNDEMRAVARGKQTAISERAEEIMNDLEKKAKPLSQEMATFRGRTDFLDLDVGEEYIPVSVESTAAHESVSASFSYHPTKHEIGISHHATFMEFRVPKGTNALMTNEGELEVILMHPTKWKVGRKFTDIVVDRGPDLNKVGISEYYIMVPL